MRSGSVSGGSPLPRNLCKVFKRFGLGLEFGLEVKQKSYFLGFPLFKVFKNNGLRFVAVAWIWASDYQYRLARVGVVSSVWVW